ncbi:MAG: peptidyl-prolyl cis-trans isomerase [Ignavibacteriae bacterium]|nr:peptidyl-prolyl cis-trans isomerase [Ignavibacteriota bacterium]
MKTQKNKRLLSKLVLLVSVLFSTYCSEDIKTDGYDITPVARVGDRIISADEFKHNFEFGISLLALNDSVSPRKAYLNFMIDELLIANKGIDLGFNKSRYVLSRLNARREDNLLEAFYQKYVHSKVNLREQDIQDAIKKASIKFRMIILPLKTIEETEDAHREASKSDLKEYITAQLQKHEIPIASLKSFETDWLDFLDLRPEILEELKDLEKGKVSKPIPFNNEYALFQVIGINRESIINSELISGTKRKKMLKRLHNIKADSIETVLLDSILTPLNFHVDGKVIEKIAPLFDQWVSEGLPDKQNLLDVIKSVSDTSRVYLKDLKLLLNQPLFSSKKSDGTVEDFFQYLTYYRKNLNNSKDLAELTDILFIELAKMFKNNNFINIAEEDGYLDTFWVSQDLKIWEQKWTYNVYSGHITKEIEVSEDEMREYFRDRWSELKISNIDTTRYYKYVDDIYNALIFEKHQKKLKKDLAKLRKEYSVEIYEDVLNSIELQDSPNAVRTSYRVIKSSTGKPVVPTVDLRWAHY